MASEDPNPMSAAAQLRERDAARVTAWIEKELGGRVRAINPQPRWRPVWFVDLERDGEVHALCVRGNRLDTEFGFSLDHEMRFQSVLSRFDIPVAKVHGWIDDPRAYVMEAVPGRPDFVEETPESERAAVMDDYIAVLARIHALPIEPFDEAGVLRAKRPEDAGRIGMQTYERAYRASKKRPDPFLEFCLGHLKRHPLDARGREAPIVWDSGQFHHRDGKIAAVLDLELGHIGDPMMDLAGFRMRDTVIGYGDFPRLYARYAEITGAPVDVEALMHHHLAFTLTNQLAFHAALAEPTPGSDFMTNLQWCSETNLFAVEALAEMRGISLPEVSLPESYASPVDPAFGHLVHWLRSFEAPDEFGQHQVRTAFRLARHLHRFDEIGEQTTQADLDDLGDFLGKRPERWQDGDERLEAFVMSDEGAHDDELIGLFHRRLTRARAMLGPEGSAMAYHHPIQRFDETGLRPAPKI